jgi:3-dehydroquinate synthase
MRSIKIKSRSGNYSVHFKSLEEVSDFCKGKTVVIDSNVYDLYQKIFQDCDLIKFTCVEENKTLEGSTHILNEFLKRKIKSNGDIVAIGGGILQDAVGFACSIYCRGIKYTLVPTTLLAQCDSCIGGKTSINFSSVKNILGTFYPPESILISTEFLNSLTERDYLSGLGEIIKFNLLRCQLDWFLSKDIKTDIEDLIYDSLTYKSVIIEIDEFDKKDRKFLNFGHTFGHALESTSNYAIPHGTAVLFGMAIANRVAVKLGHLEKDFAFDAIYNHVKHQKLDPAWFNFQDLMEVVKLDKKNTGSINMVLLTNSGPILTKIENLVILEEAVKETYETIRLRNKAS